MAHLAQMHGLLVFCLIKLPLNPKRWQPKLCCSFSLLCRQLIIRANCPSNGLLLAIWRTYMPTRSPTILKLEQVEVSWRNFTSFFKLLSLGYEHEETKVEETG